MNTRTGVIGAGLGAGAMYLLDPQRGRRRRAMLRDGISARADDSQRFFRKSGRDMGNRARGVAAKTRNRIFPAGEVDDEVLVERVRSKMGRYVSNPGAIEVLAEDGRITLRGPVLAWEAGSLVRAVGSVRGVAEVDDRLDRHSDPASISALQGGSGRMGETPEYLQRRWSPSARVAAGSLAATLLLLGLRRRGRLGVAAATLGSGLMVRSVANRPARRLIGLGAGRRADDYREAITVSAPVDELDEAPAFHERDRTGNGGEMRTREDLAEGDLSI